MDFLFNHQGNNGGDEDDKLYTANNRLYNKSLLIGSLFLIAISRSSPNKNQQSIIPEAFQSVPSVYYGSQLLLALSFFISFIGVVTSDSDTRVRFSRFCSVYSIFCFAAIILVCSPVFMLPELNTPSWFDKQVYNGVAVITQPLPLFVSLVIAIPVLHYLTPPPCRKG